MKITLSILLLSTLLLNCSHTPPKRVPSTFQEKNLTIFLIDGLDHKVLMDLVGAGRLPNIKRMIDEGARVKTGITAFPSVTGYAYFPYLTGNDASKSGILGLRWFDRTLKEGNFRSYVGRLSGDMLTDLRKDQKLLFEEYPKKHSFTANTFMDTGSSTSIKAGLPYVFAKLKDHSRMITVLSKIPLVGKKIVPKVEEVDSKMVSEGIKDLEKNPKIQWITLTAPDSHYHVTGADHGDARRYAEILESLDKDIGRYRESSVRLGQENSRIYALVSDHGVSPVTENLDVCEDMKTLNISCYRGPSVVYRKNFAKRSLEEWNQYDVISTVNGNNMSHVYVKDTPAWGAALTAERLTKLITFFRERKGVEFAVVRGPQGKTEVHSKLGSAEISVENCGFRYQVTAGVDPLGYGNLNGQCHPKADWLQETTETNYPYGIVRLHELLQNPKAGDIILTTQVGFDFGKNYEIFIGNFCGGHGGIRADQIVVPFIFTGAGIKKGVELETAISEDVGVTLRALMGIKHEGLDGRVLEEVLE